MIMTYEELLPYDGLEFSARINGSSTITTGKISVSKEGKGGRMYLCQNNHSGVSCSDKKGFNYSWSIDKDRSEELLKKGIANDVKEFILLNYRTDHNIPKVIKKESTLSLVEQAKLKYPIGTEVKSLFRDFKGIVESLDSDLDSEVIWLQTDLCNAHVYDEEKGWATVLNPTTLPWYQQLYPDGGNYIVSIHKSKSEIKEGYVYKTLHGDINRDNFVTNNLGIPSGFCPNNQDRFRMATLEEAELYAQYGKPVHIKLLNTPINEPVVMKEELKTVSIIHKYPLGKISIIEFDERKEKGIRGNYLIEGPYIVHGTYRPHESYDVDYATIIGFYKDLYLVEFTDDYGNKPRLLFKEEWLRKVRTIPFKVSMSDMRVGKWYTNELWIPGTFAKCKNTYLNEFRFEVYIDENKKVTHQSGTWEFKKKEFIEIPEIFLKEYLGEEFNKIESKPINSSNDTVERLFNESLNIVVPVKRIFPTRTKVVIFRVPTQEEIDKYTAEHHYHQSRDEYLLLLGRVETVSDKNEDIVVIERKNRSIGYNRFMPSCIITLEEYEALNLNLKKESTPTKISATKAELLNNKAKYFTRKKIVEKICDINF